MKEFDIHYQNEPVMLEKSIIICIVAVAIAYLVQHLVATVKGRSGCAGCNCKCSARKAPGLELKPSNKLLLKEIRANLTGPENSLKKTEAH